MLLLNDTRSSISFNSDLICFWWPFFGHQCGPNISWDILQIDSLMLGHCIAYLCLKLTLSLKIEIKQASPKPEVLLAMLAKLVYSTTRVTSVQPQEQRDFPWIILNLVSSSGPEIDNKTPVTLGFIINQSLSNLISKKVFYSLNAAAIWRFFHRRPVFVAMADSQQPRGNKKNNKRNHKKIQKRRKKYTWR